VTAGSDGVKPLGSAAVRRLRLTGVVVAGFFAGYVASLIIGRLLIRILWPGFTGALTLASSSNDRGAAIVIGIAVWLVCEVIAIKYALRYGRRRWPAVAD
jgi:hypothetical protein